MLIAFELPAFKYTSKRKAIATSKFYFFDFGVARSLQSRSLLKLKSPEFGEAFETYIFHELHSFCDYSNQGKLFYWRYLSGFEVDFILDDGKRRVALEVKAKDNIQTRDLKGILAPKEEKDARLKVPGNSINNGYKMNYC